MKIIIAWWDLTQSEQSIESLRNYLRQEGVEPWHTTQGLRLKTWFSNKESNLWGAIMLWESAQAMSQTLPPNKAAELIGYPATVRFCFDIEATAEGEYCQQHLNKLGLCYEPI